MREALETVIEGLARERDSLDATIRFLKARIQPEAPVPVKLPKPGPTVPDGATSIPGSAIEIPEGVFFGVKLWAAAERLLEMAGRAMTLSEMVAHLKRGGLNQKSPGLESNLSTVMVRKPDLFVKTAPATWLLRRHQP